MLALNLHKCKAHYHEWSHHEPVEGSALMDFKVAETVALAPFDRLRTG